MLIVPLDKPSSSTKKTTLTLLRGLPGSGKSTLAATFDAVHLEADMFFIQKNGEYIFNALQLGEAHHWCQSECERALINNQDVVIANTFVKHWEMQDYKLLAKKYHAELVIFTCTGNFQSIHDIDKKTIAKMKKNWQK